MSRAPKPAPPLVLNFTLNSLRNTNVSVDDDTIYYEIVTRYWHPDVTKIFRLDKEARVMNLVAQIKGVKNKGKGPEGTMVRFGPEELEEDPADHKRKEEEWITEREFMQFEEQKPGGSFVAAPDMEYRWKTHRRTLLMTNHSNNKPLLTLHPHKRHFWVFRMSKHAWFELRPEAIEAEGTKQKNLEALDRIIVSYLLVERRRRSKMLVSVKGKTLKEIAAHTKQSAKSTWTAFMFYSNM